MIELKTEDAVNHYFKNILSSRTPMIGLDIEGEYNLHCYGEHLCLIQIYDNNECAIIDPYNFKEKDTLIRIVKIVFENNKILKIMYDSSSDSRLINNLYKVKINSILDLRPAVQLLNYEKQSLSSLLEVELGIDLPPKKKFQMHNWLRRPISSEALNYAANDVIHLFKLKNILMKKLMECDLLDAYTLENLNIQTKIFNNTEDKYRFTKEYIKLLSVEKIAYNEIYALREKAAESINKPVYMILKNHDLLQIIKKRESEYNTLDSKIGNIKNWNKSSFVSTISNIIEKIASSKAY